MAQGEMLDTHIIETAELAPAPQIPEQAEQPFRFSNPHWLRQGQAVEVTWIATHTEFDTETVICENEGQMFHFDRRIRVPVTELKTVRGTITAAFPRRKKAQQLYEQGSEPRILFTPARTPETVPATMRITESDFDSYIFTGLPRSIRWSDRDTSQS
jgi:hypothetical protein